MNDKEEYGIYGIKRMYEDGEYVWVYVLAHLSDYTTNREGVVIRGVKHKTYYGDYHLRFETEITTYQSLIFEDCPLRSQCTLHVRKRGEGSCIKSVDSIKRIH